MIRVNFSSYDEIRYLKLAVKGHAGSDEKGHDLVCASASILLYTLAQSVKEKEQLGYFDVEPIIVLEEGDGLITCRCKTSTTYEAMKSVFNVIKTGYRLLVGSYPQYVELKSFG